jgi:transaldolase
MGITDPGTKLSNRVKDFVLDGFEPHYGELADSFDSHPLWKRLNELGTELWLDSGDVDAIGELWTREFSGLTTNNSLLNKEVQKGTYDEVIRQASAMLDEFPLLPDQDRALELAFILNARHGLKLVETFDANVSVEVHTALSDQIESTVNYALRFHEICPERFIVKVPFSAAGVLATRMLSEHDVPINHTLGFSARQNHLIARVGRPSYVNVFMGRLNSFVADNGLGSGDHVGEKATLASQADIRRLRDEGQTGARQIGASFRDPQQVVDLAGIDVMTIPPKIARGLLEMDLSPDELADRSGDDLTPGIDENVDQAKLRLDSLWDISPEFVSAVDELRETRLDMFTDVRLKGFFQRHAMPDVLAKWTDPQRDQARQDGKIPVLDHWRDELASGQVALDGLMNLAGWYHFDADQKAMDDRVSQLLQSTEA